MMPRFAKRRDTAELPIVEELRANGFTVEQDGKVDLLVRRHIWLKNVWVKLEVKTLKTKATDKPYKPRKDQDEQTQYCIRHCIPYVQTIEQALGYLKTFDERLRL